MCVLSATNLCEPNKDRTNTLENLQVVSTCNSSHRDSIGSYQHLRKNRLYIFLGDVDCRLEKGTRDSAPYVPDSEPVCQRRQTRLENVPNPCLGSRDIPLCHNELTHKGSLISGLPKEVGWETWDPSSRQITTSSIFTPQCEFSYTKSRKKTTTGGDRLVSERFLILWKTCAKFSMWI
jgi:hypothetical protein